MVGAETCSRDPAEPNTRCPGVVAEVTTVLVVVVTAEEAVVVVARTAAMTGLTVLEAVCAVAEATVVATGVATVVAGAVAVGDAADVGGVAGVTGVATGVVAAVAGDVTDTVEGAVVEVTFAAVCIVPLSALVDPFARATPAKTPAITTTTRATMRRVRGLHAAEAAGFCAAESTALCSCPQCHCR
jgi:hypothetical protein